MSTPGDPSREIGGEEERRTGSSESEWRSRRDTLRNFFLSPPAEIISFLQQFAGVTSILFNLRSSEVTERSTIDARSFGLAWKLVCRRASIVALKSVSPSLCAATKTPSVPIGFRPRFSASCRPRRSSKSSAPA